MRLPLTILSAMLGTVLITSGCGRVNAVQAPRMTSTPTSLARSKAPSQVVAGTGSGTRVTPVVAMMANGMGTARGRVLAQSNQQPVAGVTVVAQPGGQRAITDATGTFTFSGLAGGNYTFQAMSQGLVQMAPAGTLVMPGQSADIPAILMIPGMGPSGITRINYVLEKEFGRSGEAPAPLLSPVGVVARGSAVQVLDRNSATFVKTGVIRQYDAEAGTFQGKYGDYSKWLGFAQMKDNVKAITLDRQGRTVVVDGGRKLWRFDSSGKKEKVAELSTEAEDITLDATGHLVTAGSTGLTRLSPDGEGGQSLGSLSDCRAVAGGKDGLWVITGQKVGKVSPEGQMILEFGPGGTDGNQSFSEPVDLAVDPRNGHLVVVDKATQQVYVYDGIGNLIGNIGQGVFDKPVAVTVDAGGRVYVVDQAKKKVYKFLPGVTS